jgi:hypothetical protein
MGTLWECYWKLFENAMKTLWELNGNVVRILWEHYIDPLYTLYK